MKIVGRPQFEYQLCERKSGSKFIKIPLYINDADGYGEIEDIEYELSNNAKVAEFIATTEPSLLSK